MALKLDNIAYENGKLMVSFIRDDVSASMGATAYFAIDIAKGTDAAEVRRKLYRLTSDIMEKNNE